MIKIEAFFVISISLLALSQAEPKCGINKNGLQPRIVGGDVVPNHAYPWMAYLEIKSKVNNRNIVEACGGSLINKQWILSAAHCFENFISGEVYLGTNDVTNKSKHTIHFKFDPKDVFKLKNFSNYENGDIALLKLSKPINFNEVHNYISPICLPKKSASLNETNCFGVGWGRIGVNSPTTSNLLQAHLPIIPLDQCQKRFLVNQNHICAGNKVHSVCSGDSGGPLQCLNKDNTWTIEGIVSYGPMETCKMFQVFTRVEKYIDWISNIINHNQ